MSTPNANTQNVVWALPCQHPECCVSTPNANIQNVVWALPMPTATMLYDHSQCQQPQCCVSTPNANTQNVVWSLPTPTSRMLYEHSNANSQNSIIVLISISLFKQIWNMWSCQPQRDKSATCYKKLGMVAPGHMSKTFIVQVETGPHYQSHPKWFDKVSQPDNDWYIIEPVI